MYLGFNEGSIARSMPRMLPELDTRGLRFPFLSYVDNWIAIVLGEDAVPSADFASHFRFLTRS